MEVNEEQHADSQRRIKYQPGWVPVTNTEKRKKIVYISQEEEKRIMKKKKREIHRMEIIYQK